MATFHDRTAAPVFQRRLLRASGPCRILSSDEVVALTANIPELPAPPLLSDDSPEAIRDDIDALLNDYARTLYLRRQLAQAAEHGAALLASLGQPRLVTPDSVPLDREVIGDAVDNAISLLDALDAPGEDREDGGDVEPSLGWITSTAGVTFPAGTLDVEHDTADAEPSLASPERHPSPPEWAWYRVYVDHGPESSQLRWAEGARDDREKIDEDGPIDDDELDGAGEVDAEPSIGWPEDVTAEVVFIFSAEGDAEHDDVDLEGEPAGDLTWVFGPSRREVAHV